MQSQRRNDLQVSSPQRNNFGPYSEVAINPRTGQDMPEEGMPFINDPSNRDNESRKYSNSDCSFKKPFNNSKFQ